MAANGKYKLALNLGLLGLNFYLSSFVIAKAKENLFESFNKTEEFSFSIGSLVENSSSLSVEEFKHKSKDNLFLTLKVFADKQSDYDQRIYLAEGNVKAIVNNGILKSDILRYEKLNGILTAKGNVSFRKGDQYFIGKEFIFNLLKNEGVIKEVYGIININNVIKDLNIDPRFIKKNRLITPINGGEEISYNDGIEFSFGNIKLPKNKITRSDKSIGEINNWRFKSKLINIQKNGWKSNRMYFTNDPFDPHQISFEAKDVIAEESEQGELVITSSQTNLIVGNRTKFFLGKRIFGDRKKKEK